MATGKFAGRNLRDRSIGESAGIRPFKLDLNYASVADFLAAKSAQGENSASAEEGDFFYDTTSNTFKVYDGAVWAEPARYAAVNVTAAELKALAATQKVLVPGETGKVHILDRAICVYDAGATGYTLNNAGDDLLIKYTNGAGAAATADLPLNSFLTSTSDGLRTFGVLSSVITPVAGAPLVLDNNGGGEMTLGTGSVTIHLWYRTVATGL